MMQNVALEVAYFAVMGMLGGTTWALIKARKWSDLKKFKYLKRILLGVIIGFLYWHLYSEMNFPNSVMAFVSGYMGTDFVTALVEKLTSKHEGKQS